MSNFSPPVVASGRRGGVGGGGERLKFFKLKKVSVLGRG